jgi:large subunit ribosomal protein L20
MSRVKRGVTVNRRHKKVLQLTKGHRGRRHSTFKAANESMMHALRYSYEDRKDRKGEFRRLWIVRINAAARLSGISYSQMMHGLKKAGIELDRKVLADLAVTNPPAFAALAERAKGSLAA